MYTINRSEVIMRRATGEDRIDLTSTGDVAFWGPGFYAFRILAVAIVLDATPGDAGVVKFDLRPVHDSDSNRTDGTVATINLATTHTVTAGTGARVVYSIPSSPVTVYPGQEVVAEVTDASASVDEARICLVLELLYENPSNMLALSGATTMSATT